MYVKDHGQCHLVKTICHEGKSLIKRNVHVKFKSSTFKWLKTYDKLKVKGFRNVGQRLRSTSQGPCFGMIHFLSLMKSCFQYDAYCSS